MPIEITRFAIDGIFAIQPRIFGDSRGYFLESYSERDFVKAGIDTRFVQDNQSKSRKGVLRGLHFQKEHPQAKLVRVISGEVYDVAVDLRSSSPTLGQWVGVTLTGNLHNQLFIPAGFAHGFIVTSDEAVFTYKCTDFYYPEDEDGIRWNDPTIVIEWPDIGARPALSKKDEELPLFDSRRIYF